MDIITLLEQIFPLYLFSGLAYYDLLTLFFLCVMRIAPIVALAPFLGFKLPGSVKMGLTCMLALIALPKAILTTQSHVVFSPLFLAYSLKEVLIGSIFAILATIPFYVAQAAGVVIDFSRGSSSLTVNDPIMQTQISPIGVLYNYLMIVIFFGVNGPFLFIDAVIQSYQLLPPDKFLPAAFFGSDVNFWKGVFKIMNQIATVTLQIAAPSVVAVLMADLFLGIANRLAPNVQIIFLGTGFKSLLGLLMMFLGWTYILQQLGTQGIHWVRDFEKFVSYLRST